MASKNESEELQQLRKNAMSLFAPQSGQETLADKLRREILPNIEKLGTVEKVREHFINVNIERVLSKASGSPRINVTAAKHATLILSQPLTLAYLSAFEIRCCLCKKVISYPAWYYNIKYDINQFHYFVCFDNSSPNKPTARCYRRV